MKKKQKKKKKKQKKATTEKSSSPTRPIQGHDIVKVESCAGAVTLTLENGVKLHICSNDGYVHVNFCGIGSSQVVATPFSHLDYDLKQELTVANQLNLFYRAAGCQ